MVWFCMISTMHSFPSMKSGRDHSILRPCKFNIRRTKFGISCKPMWNVGHLDKCLPKWNRLAALYLDWPAEGCVQCKSTREQKKHMWVIFIPVTQLKTWSSHSTIKDLSFGFEGAQFDRLFRHTHCWVIITYRLPKANTDLKTEVLSHSFLNINIHGSDHLYYHKNMVNSWQKKGQGPKVPYLQW